MAQTLKFGNKVWAAKEGAVLAYNDENSNYKPLPFDFTRASSATRVNKSGLIETMRTGVARIDYLDSADGVLLLEPASTNKLIYSEDFTQWSSLNLTVTSDYAISPSGKQDASFIKPSSGSNEHKIQLVPSTQTDSQETFSVYAKPNGFDWLYLRTNINGSWVNGYANFNITTGKANLLGSGFTSSSIEDAGNGWYRCSVTFSNRGNDPLQIFSMPISQSSSVSNGDGINGALIYAAQAELGNLSSYIPTSGSTVTRAAETCNNSGNSEVFNDSEGVLFVNVNLGVNQSASRYFAISDGTNNNRIQLGRGSSAGSLSFFVRSNGSSTIGVIIDEGTGEILKLAVKYKSNDYAIWSNGFEIYQNSSVSSTPLNISRFNFAEADGVGSDFYGKTKEVGYYNTALTDLELETLTSYRNWISMVNELNLNIIYNG